MFKTSKLRQLWPISLITSALTLCVLAPLQPNHAPKTLLTGDTAWVHDPSRAIECDGKFYLYTTGDLIPSRVSSDGFHWQKGPPALTSLPSWLQARVPLAKGSHVWAPDVIKVGDEYWLFYSYSTFGSKTSAIGLLTSATLDPQNPNYKWKDKGLVVATDGTQDYNAIDPAPLLTDKGELWLSFGSWWSGIRVVQLDIKTGQPIGPMSRVAAGQPIGPEAPYLHQRGDYFYLFENEGYCCRGMNSTYRIMVGRSRRPNGPFLDRAGRNLAHGGGSVFMETQGALIGPGHVGIVSRAGRDWVTYHFYDGQSNGVPTLGMRDLAWDAQNWPKAAPPLAGGRYALINAASGLALGVAEQSKKEGARLDQFAWNGDAMQSWNVVDLGDGTYALQSPGSGQYLDLLNCDAADGAPVNQQPWLNNDCQCWRIESTGDGLYRVISKAAQNALSLPDNHKAPLALVESRVWNGNDGQKWKFQALR